MAPSTNPLSQFSPVIQTGFRKWYELEAEKRRLEEKYLADVKADIKEHKQQLKTDTGLEQKDLTVWFNVYKRYRVAADLMDEEDRDRIHDNLRTIFNALAQGQMLDFIEALEIEDATPAQAEPQEWPEDAGADYAKGEAAGEADIGDGDEAVNDGEANAPATADDDAEDGPEVIEDEAVAAEAEVPMDAGAVYNDGAQAGLDGKSAEDNPYEADTPAHGMWEQGRVSTAGSNDGGPATVRVIGLHGGAEDLDPVAAAAFLTEEAENAETLDALEKLEQANADALTDLPDDLRAQVQETFGYYRNTLGAAVNPHTGVAAKDDFPAPPDNVTELRAAQ